MPRDGQKAYVSGAQQLDDYYRDNTTFLGTPRPDPNDWAFSPIKEWPDDKDPPPIPWLVEGCFIAGTVSLLSSDGGLGKSLLMQQLCTAAAIGKRWLGLTTRAVRSVAMFCEDDRAELWRRQRRINEHYNCRIGDLEDLKYLAPIGKTNLFCTFDRWSTEPVPTAKFRYLGDVARDFGAEIVIIDTVSDVFGGNEIARDQVRAFLNMMRGLAVELQACVILSAHASNEGLSSESGLSGSRGWNNHVRSRLWLSEKKKDEGGDVRFLKTMKMNWARRGSPLKLRWVDGVFCNETID